MYIANRYYPHTLPLDLSIPVPTMSKPGPTTTHTLPPCVLLFLLKGKWYRACVLDISDLGANPASISLSQPPTTSTQVYTAPYTLPLPPPPLILPARQHQLHTLSIDSFRPNILPLPQSLYPSPPLPQPGYPQCHIPCHYNHHSFFPPGNTDCICLILTTWSLTPHLNPFTPTLYQLNQCIYITQ